MRVATMISTAVLSTAIATSALTPAVSAAASQPVPATKAGPAADGCFGGDMPDGTEVETMSGFGACTRCLIDSESWDSRGFITWCWWLDDNVVWLFARPR